MEEEFTNIERIIISATDSENLVKKLVSNGTYSQDIYNVIKRNIDHLNIILNREEIKKTNSPKLYDFQEAITLGRDFISNYTI